MGMDICGWVEVTWRDANDRDWEWAWSGCIRLDPLLNRQDEVGWALFGFSKVPLEQKHTPIASRRGLPSNPSDEVRRDMERIIVYENQHGPGDFGNYTWIDFDDVEAIDWESMGVDDATQSEWREVFEMIRLLRRADRFKGAAFRIVAWTNW